MKYRPTKGKIKIAHFVHSQFELFNYYSKRIFLSLFIFLFLILAASCTGKYDEAEEQSIINGLYKGDFSEFINPKKSLLAKLNNTDEGSLYYIGLYLKQNRNTRASAREFFNYATKHSVFPYNKLSRNELYYLSSVDKKLKIIEETYEDTKLSFEEKDLAHKKKQKLLFLLKQFDKLELDADEYLASIKFDRDTALLLEEIFNSNQEIKLKKNKALPRGFKEINQARIKVFKKNYKEAWELFHKVLEVKPGYKYLGSRKILSDIGRSALFGSENYAEDALFFEKKLQDLEACSFEEGYKKTEKYMYAFYAARLNLKARKKANVDRALELFKHSLKYAPSDNDFDNALWYYLDILKSKSFNTFFEELIKSQSEWKNAYIYEDLIAYTCRELVAQRNRKAFIEFKKAIDKTNLKEAQARNSYVLARLDQTSKKDFSDEEIERLFSDVCKDKHNFFYYRILSNAWLDKEKANFSEDNLFSYVSYRKTKLEENSFPDSDCIKVINGLVKYKLYSQIYRHVYSIYPKISIENAEKLSRILAENADYPNSIRLMNYALRKNKSKVSRSQLKLIYPKAYAEIVEKYAKEFNIPPYLLLGLIRSESFFKAEVISHAGAIGLTQLMKPTAKDIARRLKMKDYDLRDPDTNIKFGAYYISKMIQSKKGDMMPAICSYNAGPTAVRRWQRKFRNYPADLFLELVPYNETRGYGRHVFTASAIYANLYYGKSYKEVIEEVFRF